MRSPELDAWDAYRFVPKDGPEYLDRCNGHSAEDHGGKYHYHATATWPYIMGCFSGTPSADAGREEDRQMSGAGRRGRGPQVDPRPSPEQVAKAAAELGIDEAKLAEALGLTNGRITPMNYLSAARALKMDYRALSRALGVEPHFNPTRRGRGPGQRARGPRQRP